MSNVMTHAAVESVGQASVTTRFGVKPTFFFTVNGETFKTGFKRHNLNQGDVVSFPYTTGKYGNEVDVTQITKAAAGIAASPAPVSAPAASTGGSTTAPRQSYSGGGKGVFPIPPLDGQRSIVRQNALTNARELLVGTAGFADASPEGMAAEVIRIAKVFERYTAGDMDLEEVQAEQEQKAA
jgi:hypothetical protein